MKEIIAVLAGSGPGTFALYVKLNQKILV